MNLAASELRRKVQASDIINIVVDIEGVEAIYNVQLRAYDKNGIAIGRSENWTRRVRPHLTAQDVKIAHQREL